MRRSYYSSLLLVLTLFASSASSQSQFKLKNFTPEVFQASTTALTMVRHAMPASELGLLVNTQDAQSVAVASLYKSARNIPDANIIQVSFPVGSQNMSGAEFNALRADVLSRTPSSVQAFALTWTNPWMVDCMSITSAFAFGFNSSYCQPANAQTCYTTLFSNYFSSDSKQARTDLGIIPTMMLAGTNTNNVQAVINRGRSSDLSFPRGDGYLLTTTDSVRSSRSSRFSYAASVWNDPVNSLKITHVNNSAGTGSDYLTNVNNILFYFTGTYFVEGLNTLQFVPGAVADHLTSYGGALTAGLDESQMSSLRWLEAGATGSYGTVVEPCNYRAKFPDPAILFHYYFSGESLIESYWKSVAMPIEGIFIGEPLARPWGTKVKSLESGEVEVHTSAFRAGKSYHLLKQSTEDASLYDVVQTIPAGSPRFQTFTFLPTTTSYYLVSEDEVYYENNPPSLLPVENKKVEENKVLAFPLIASDPEVDKLTYSSSNLPTGSSLDPLSGLFSWKPSYQQAGIYDVVFEVSDGISVDSISVRIEVKNFNRAPTLTAVSNKTIREDALLTIPLVAKDIDNDTLTFTGTNLPQGSSLDPNTGVFSWKPSFTQAGLYSGILVSVSDGYVSASRTFSVTVTNTNRKPIISVLGSRTGAEGQTFKLSVSVSDPDGDPVTTFANGLPVGGAYDETRGVFSWTPTYTQASTRNVRFYVNDGNVSNSELVTIVIANTNRPPVLIPIGSRSVKEGVLLKFSVSGSDPDGTKPTFSALNLPQGATFSASTKIFSWKPVLGQTGTYIVPFTVTDGALSARENVSIKVIKP